MPPPDERARRLQLMNRAEQAAAAGLLAISLAAIAAYWVWLGGHHGELLELDRAPGEPIEFLVDLNEADWPELMQLPGIGETLGRRIVEDRAAHGPFVDHADLMRVRGIGPKTLAEVQPFLLPLPPPEQVAGGG